ncbi:hypothetical protein PR048_002810, partial [Dryococelus australis]
MKNTELYPAHLHHHKMLEQPGPSSISVGPLDISPVPTIRKRISTSGLKATSPAVITFSPCKQTLVLSLEKSKRIKCQPYKRRGNYKRGGAASAGTGRRRRARGRSGTQNIFPCATVETLIWTSALFKVDLQLKMMQTACFVVKSFQLTAIKRCEFSVHCAACGHMKSVREMTDIY